MRRTLESLLLIVAVAACGGDRISSTDSGQNQTILPPPNGVAQFSVLPVAIAPGLSLTALGSLNPPGHVLPTTHVYFYDWDLSKDGAPRGTDDRTVYMPATGTVFHVVQQTAEAKVMFRATENFYFYLDHLLPTVPLTVGHVIPVGTVIGHTGPGTTLDLGALDMSVTHAGFLNAARYPMEALHYVSPWKYFTPELQAQIYPHVYRAPSASDKDGRADFGIRGTLAGDWFLQGTPVESSSGSFGWTRTISFAYDYYDPSQPRISIGGTVGPPGVWGIDASAPRPESVTVGTGLVVYKLYSMFDAKPLVGVLLVRLVDEATIKVQVFMGNTSATQFDGREFTFVR